MFTGKLFRSISIFWLRDFLHRKYIFSVKMESEDMNVHVYMYIHFSSELILTFASSERNWKCPDEEQKERQ